MPSTRPALRRAARLAAGGLGLATAVWAVCADPNTGPDVIVGELMTPWGNYVQGDPIGGKRAYAIGTRSLNIGKKDVAWFASTNQHPVIGQNLYRLKTDTARPAGRFEQIGQSWLKHGFTALAEEIFCDCTFEDGHGAGTWLGQGCADPYTASLNGDRNRLGPRWQVDATTGVYTYPYDNSGAVDDATDRRLIVADADLDPALNPGARYFGEGQYITADDAQAGNGLNNASFREAVVTNPTSRNLGWGGTLGGTTTQRLPAIAAWALVDGAVQLVDVDTERQPVQRFHVARKVLDLGTGMFRHEIAVHNLNSDLSGRRLVVRFPAATVIANPGFSDVDYHSGEPFVGTDWTIDGAVANEIAWSTESYAANPNANALRWGTTYNFWFDATADGTGVDYRIETFKPGCPRQISFGYPGPSVFADDFECGATLSWTTESGL